MRRPWGLHARIAVALVAVGVVTLTAVAVAASAFSGVRHHQQQVVDSYYEAMTTSYDRFVALVDAEAAIRGYVLAGDETMLEPVRSLDADAVDDERLRELLAQDEQALAALDRASASAAAWWDLWAAPTMTTIESGEPVSLDDVEAEGGRQLFEQVRADYATYIDTVGDRRAEAVRVLDERTRLLFMTVVAVAIAAIAAVAVLWMLLRRWVSGPVSALAAETRVVRDGDLDHGVAVDGPPEIVGLGRDVEEMRRRLVEEIGLAAAAGGRLAEAHAALEEQAADLERSNRELEQFAYVASHDLQEPLRKVASFTQLLQRRYAGQLDERADQYIAFAVDGAKRMQQLINDLLEFSRVGRLTAMQTDVELEHCLDRALRDLDTAIEESGAVITHDDLPVVHGEQLLLTQLLVNLLGNALKFRADHSPHIHVGAGQHGEVWELWCSDDGIGIEPQYADRVFAVFQRLHPKDVYSGTGIGLALCQKIVEYHGGRIWVDTEHEGPGTTIRWTLPVIGADPGSAGSAGSALAAPGASAARSAESRDDESNDEDDGEHGGDAPSVSAGAGSAGSGPVAGSGGAR